MAGRGRVREGKSEGGEGRGRGRVRERVGGEKESFFSAYPPMGSYWVSMQKLSSLSQLWL